MKIEYLEIKDPNSDKVTKFHDNVLVETFPDYHGREDISILRRNLKEGSWSEGDENCRYHLIVALDDNRNVVGGVSFYSFGFKDYALGMGSYLGVKKEFCSNGIGTKLIELRGQTLFEDAKEFGRNLKGLIIQVNDPCRMSDDEIKNDSMNPYEREKFWKRRGYKKIAFNFIQPSIRDGDPPMIYLSLYIYPYCSQWENINLMSSKGLSDIVYCFIRCTGTVGSIETDPSYIQMKSELAKQEFFVVV